MIFHYVVIGSELDEKVRHYLTLLVLLLKLLNETYTILYYTILIFNSVRKVK